MGRYVVPVVVAAALALCAGCYYDFDQFANDAGGDGGSAGVDAGVDAAADAEVHDTGFDAALDAGSDTSYPSDASDDAADTGTDAATWDAGGDSGPAEDAGDDATVEDTGAADAADAGTDSGVDAGAPDAGEDAALADAGVDAALDSGSDVSFDDAQDGSYPSDASEDAANIGEDAGIADAGTTDAGCTPDCSGKQCGDNGCGGSCGGCGSPPASTCPNANTIREYNPVGSCAAGTCDYVPNDRTCQYGCSNGRCSNCTADCTNKNCGLDGCGGSCGDCTTCLSVCQTGWCAAAHHASSACDQGDVFWFDSCGVREERKEDCTAAQVCFNNACCTPQCAGKCSGPDNCGGTCADNCVFPQTCGGGGTTNVCGCTPSCAGKCGGQSDGCTGTCPDPCNGHGTCTAGACKMDNGQRCTASAGCTSGHCGNGFCCASGDCCAVVQDCPAAYTVQIACINTTTCQGSYGLAGCNAQFTCQTDTFEDDSECKATTLSKTCGYYLNRYCNGEATQTEPQCATTCSSDGDCSSNNCNPSPSGTKYCTDAAKACSDNAGNGMNVGDAVCYNGDRWVCQSENTFAAAVDCATNCGNYPDVDSCTNGVCGLCPTSCASHSDCKSPAFCRSDNSCNAQLANGSDCSVAKSPKNVACSSGFCYADSFDGAGEFCATDATTCVNNGANYANGYELCSGNSWYKSCGSGTWGAQQNCAAAYCDAGGGAQSGYKIAETCTSSAAGGCNVQSCISCTPYKAASTTSCKTTCSSGSDCWSGYICPGSSCVDDPCDPDPCNGHGSCSSGTCTCNTGYAGTACDSCDTGYSGYPTCTLCGAYGQPCCASDVCYTGNTCNSGVCVSDTCTGKDDFTWCKTVTSPDRSYDICVSAACVSPGCGNETCNEPGPHFALPDTDQRLCYNNSGTMTCTAFPCDGVGTPDFCGQDWQYGWDTTHAQTARYTKTEPVSGYPVVADNITGLQWQGCPAGLSGISCATGTILTKTWSDALAYCEGLSWADHTDWRLPDRYELQSIADYGRVSPSIDTTAFPATPSNYFWSSTSYAGGSSYAWLVGFSFGYVYNGGKTSTYDVRCVRGGP